MGISKGDLIYVSAGYSVGSEQRSGRPAVVVSNNVNNRASSTVEIVYLTRQPKKDLPTHVMIRSAPEYSTALCEQINTISVERIARVIGHITDSESVLMDKAMAISLDIGGACPIPKSWTETPANDIVHMAELTPAQCPPPEDTKLRKQLEEMTVKFETIKELYDSLLAAVLQQPK